MVGPRRSKVLYALIGIALLIGIVVDFKSTVVFLFSILVLVGGFYGAVYLYAQLLGLLGGGRIAFYILSFIGVMAIVNMIFSSE